MAPQVDTVFVWVTNIDASVEWYAKLRIASGPRYEAWQTMEVDGETMFALHEGDRPDGRATGAVAFRVDDLDTELVRLARLGIEPTDDEITDTGVVRFTTFHDPDDNDIQLLERG
jgi:catechol 2,3-dioxygenase-like lactoylglutathione lyase family enzyme